MPHGASLALRADETRRVLSLAAHALLLRRCVPREVSRLTPVLGGAPVRSEREEVLCTSAITFFLLLNSAEDLRLWQLMAEADVARSIHQIHLRAPEAPAVPLARLLEGEHTLQKPLGRAASTFIEALREYEHSRQRTHPLMTASIRGSA